MNLDTQVRLAVTRHFAEQGVRPSAKEVADAVGTSVPDVLQAYKALCAQRLLVLEEDGCSIRMAPPFSGVETQHVVTVDDRRYYANCAWDALGIPAALKGAGMVHSRCEQSRQTLELEVSRDGPPPCDWLFHTHVPAAHWWDDVTFT